MSKYSELDKATCEYVEDYIPKLQALLDKEKNGDHERDKVDPSVYINELDKDSYRKCAALKFISSNQKNLIGGYKFVPAYSV
jgi:hypothetical protein